MGNRILAGEYEIMDTLFENGLQSVFLARPAGSSGKAELLINEFRDGDVIYQIKDSFSQEKCKFVKSLREAFYIDFNFYVVSQLCSGAALQSFLSGNSLRLAEKMYIADSLLGQAAGMSGLSPLLQYILCDPGNLNIVNKKNVCFNCNLRLNEDETGISYKELTKRIGHLLCMIFANTADAAPENAADYAPPAMLPIIQKCLEGHYPSVKSLYDDFKALLLYSVFIGNLSVDGQVQRNISKARLKNKLSPVKKAAVAFILLFALLGAGWWGINRFGGGNAVTVGPPAVRQNSKPAAKFAASNNKVYEGEEVIFTSQSSDPDLNDAVKSYLWTISREGASLFDSADQNIAFKFEKAGKYAVNLVVTDQSGEASDPYILPLEVLPKQQIPEGAQAGGDTDDLK